MSRLLASVLRRCRELLRSARVAMVAVVAALLIVLAAVEPLAGQSWIEEAKLTASNGAREAFLQRNALGVQRRIFKVSMP